MSDRTAQFHSLYRELRIADQIKWYHDRRVEYERAHEQALVVRNSLLMLSALAGLSGFSVGTGRAIAGVAAALFAALAGAVTAFETLIGFSKLVKLYADAEFNLAEAEIDWEATGPTGDLATQLDRVEDVSRAERSQWGQLAVEKTDEPPPDSAL